MLLPLFPLQTMQVPGALLQLQIFEPRYRQLLADLAEKDPAEREIGVVSIRQGREVGAEHLPTFAESGCAVRLVDQVPVGGRTMVTAVGTWRFTVSAVVETGTPYLQAEVAAVADGPADEDELSRAAARLRAAVEAYAGGSGAELPEAPDELAWLVARGGPVPFGVQTELLADPDPVHRLEVLTRLLRTETTLLRHTSSVPFRPDRHGPAN